MRALPQLDHQEIPRDAEALRADVRSFLDTALRDRTPAERAQSWMGFDADFSRALGARGWIGLSLPRAYGGAGASNFARYVVIEELLAAGAPVAAHWIADRQSAPLILRFGDEAQKQRLLPGICRGETYFCIGMSEPNSGSDLASIASRAERRPGGWRLNGRKLWTTYAHRCHYMIALVRTAPATDERHRGMSQFLIDLRTPGVSVRPIRDLSGSEHFNEVTFDDVLLDEDALIGTEGNGWAQVNAELAYERSGPERFLSSIALLNAMIGAVGEEPDRLQAREIGRVIAKLHALRTLSIAVTAQLEKGADPSWSASCVKDIGTGLEQEIPEIAVQILDDEARTQGGGDFAKVLAYVSQAAPSFSLRGGTREILRGIIARGLGLR